MEIWKNINGFEDYLISNFGRVKTKERLIRYAHSVTGNEHFRRTNERALKIYLNDRTGYKFVQLYKNNKPYNKTIHRLVAENFIENEKNLPLVNHIDGNKHHNTLKNLEWCSNEYNHEHATKSGLKAKGSKIGTSKLNERLVFAIKYFIKKGFKDNELSQAFSISRPSISLIRSGKSWKHITLTGEELTIK